MTTPERYQTGTERNIGGWAYKDPEQMQFAIACGNEHFGLPAFDDHIDTLPDCPVKTDLLSWRENAFSAFKSGNRLALRGWLQAAWVAWKTELTFDDIHRTLQMGVEYSRGQSDKAKKPRGKLPDDNNSTVADIVQKIASDHPEETAKELWPQFYSELDQRQLSPQEHDAEVMAKCSISFDYRDSRKSITFGRFANIISEHRKKKSR